MAFVSVLSLPDCAPGVIQRTFLLDRSRWTGPLWTRKDLGNCCPDTGL